MAQISTVPQIKGKYSFDDAVTLTGFGAFNIYLFLTIGGFLLCVIVETMSMMFIGPAAKCDLNLSLPQQGLLSSISFLGVVFASYGWGYFADTRGRKNVLIVSLFSSFITSILCSFVKTSWLFILLRFINGGCIGGASSIVYAYIGEFHNDKLRPAIVSGVAVFVALGNTYLPGMAWLILPQNWSIELEFLDLEFRAWRILMIVYAAPSLLFAIMLCFIPESPKFVITQGKSEEALEILRTMFKVNKGKSKDDYLVTEIIWDDLGLPKTNGFLKTLWKQTAPLYRKPLLFITLGVSILQFGMFAANSGMTMWYPTILNAVSRFQDDRPNDDLTFCNSIQWERSEKNRTLSDPDIIAVCNDDVQTDVFAVSLVVGLVYAVTYVLISLFINIIGKKNLLYLFIVVVTASGMVSQYVEGYNMIQITMGIFIIGGVQCSITNAIVVDLFPTQVRAMALAISLMFGRLGAMVGTNVVGPLIYKWCDVVFYVFTLDYLVLMIIIFFLPSNKHIEKMVDSSV